MATELSHAGLSNQFKDVLTPLKAPCIYIKTLGCWVLYYQTQSSFKCLQDDAVHVANVKLTISH